MRGDTLARAPHSDGWMEYLEQTAALARKLLERAPCLTLGDLAVNGQDAMAVGLSGPAIGRALNGLLAQVAEGQLPNQRQQLLEQLTRLAAEST